MKSFLVSSKGCAKVFDDIVNEIVFESVNRSMKNYLLLREIFMVCSKTGREIFLSVSWWEECW